MNQLSRLTIVLASMATAVLLAPPTLAQDDPGDRRGRAGQRDGERGQRDGQFRGQDGQRRDRQFRGGQGGQQGRGGPGGGRGGNMFQQMMQPEFLRRDLPFVTDQLALDDGQSTIVESLILDYEAAFAEASESIRERFTELRPRRERDPEQEEMRRAVIEDMRALRREMRAAREAGEGIDPAMMEEMQKKMEPLRERLREMRPAFPEGAELVEMQDKMSDLNKAWQQEREALRREFLGNLQAILTEAQLGDWPSFDQALRRQKTLPLGRLSGENIDLFLLLRDMGLTEEDLWPMQDVLAGYAGMLDQRLIARNQHLETGMAEMFLAMMSRDIDRAIQMAEREATLRQGVRDVNDQYREIVAGVLAEQLDETLAELLRSEYRERAFARIYRPTSTARAFQIARGLDLEPEIAEAVLSLEEIYLDELGRLNTRLEATTRETEPANISNRFRRWAERMNGQGGPGQWRRGGQDQNDDPIRAAFNERGELDQRYRQQLEALLTEEQIAELPVVRQRGQRGDRGVGRGGDQGAGEQTNGDRNTRRQRMIEEFDKDGDGELSQDELDAARESMRNRRRGGGGD